MLSYVLKVRAHLRLQIDTQSPSAPPYFASASVSVNSAPTVLSPALLFTDHCPLITTHYPFNSCGINLFADPHPLNLVASIFYTNIGGREPRSPSYFASASVSVNSAPSVLSPTLLFADHCSLITAHHLLTPFRMNTCKNAPKPASLTTFRINTCKSVSKQRTLTTFRMNTYEKHRGVGLLWLTRHPVKDVCPVCPELLGERRSGARDLSRPARARRDKFRGAATRRLTRKRPEGSAADEAGGEDVSS